MTGAEQWLDEVEQVLRQADDDALRDLESRTDVDAELAAAKRSAAVTAWQDGIQRGAPPIGPAVGVGAYGPH